MFHHVNKFPKPWVLVHHVKEQILIAADVAQLQECVAMAQAPSHKIAPFPGRGNGFGLLHPVDGADAHNFFGVRRQVGFKALPVRQRVPGDGAGDAVLGRFPNAAPVIPVRDILAGNRVEVQLYGRFRPLKIRKQKGVRFHEVQKLFLWVGIPAGTVDAVAHGDIVRPFEAGHTQIIFPKSHSIRSSCAFLLD